MPGKGKRFYFFGRTKSKRKARAIERRHPGTFVLRGERNEATSWNHAKAERTARALVSAALPFRRARPHENSRRKKTQGPAPVKTAAIVGYGAIGGVARADFSRMAANERRGKIWIDLEMKLRDGSTRRFPVCGPKIFGRRRTD